MTSVAALAFSTLLTMTAFSPALGPATQTGSDPAGSAPTTAARTLAPDAIATQVLFAPDLDVEGMSEYDCFRIPAVVRTKQGTLLAFAEARKDVGTSWCHDAGDIDLVVRRSTDDGATWGPMITVAEGDPSDPTRLATRGNPAPIVVDGGPHDGRIVLLTTTNPAGSSSPRTPYVQYSTFEQDGAAWSEATSLADAIDRPEWGWYATGPVHGIQLRRGPHPGRLVVGINVGTPDGPLGGLVYSDDAGTTWHLGGTRSGIDATINPQEVSPIELVDGRVYLAARNNATGAAWPRAYAVSTDGGDTLSGPFTQVTGLAATPRVQGSTLRLRATDEGDRYDRILLATPVHKNLRKNLTIYSSYDEGATWRDPVRITTDRSGYSDMVEIGNGTIGLMYEAGAYPGGDARDEIRFARLAEADLGLPDGAAGPTTPDESGAGLDGYVRGGASLTDGRYGRAIELDGANDHVRLPYAESLALGSGDFTLTAWFRYGATRGDQAIFWAYGQGETAPQVWLRAEPGSSRIRGLMTTSSGTAAVSSDRAYDDQAWHHVVLQRASGRLVLRIDGTQVGSVAAPSGSVSTVRPFRMYLGQRLDGKHRFDGQLDEVRLYARALTTKELSSIREANSTNPPGVLLRLPFETMGP
ncbi:MAG TPA: sialidase family protein [Actinopolymorphaceae bacterium]